MSARYVIIVATVVLCAGALLYGADHRALFPTTPQSPSLAQVR